MPGGQSSPVRSGAPKSEDSSPYVRDATSGVFRRRDGSSGFPYSDGDEVEARLESVIAAAHDLSVLSDELAAQIQDWPSAYHLSSRRSNLLRPLQPLLTGTVLEVGAGCGALTRFIGECGAQVVALEPSTRRAGIAASRCRDLPNVTVVCDRIERFQEARKFDVVTLVGVLEYARVYGESSEPVAAMLGRCRSLLSPNGRLIVAIENQLGLKYFAGYVEDHLGVPMQGINDLYTRRSPVTFGKEELLARLRRAGFESTALYVPLPDYKLPVAVVTPTGLGDPSLSQTLTDVVMGTPYLDPQRLPLSVFSLERGWRAVTRNGLLSDLANSFLVVAGLEGGAAVPASDEPLVMYWGLDRRKDYRKVTEIRRRSHGVEVHRSRLAADRATADPDAPLRMVLPQEALAEGELWTQDLSVLVNTPGWGLVSLARWTATWVAEVERAAGIRTLEARTRIPGRLLDATPFNLVRSPGGSFSFIDLEWELREPLEFGWLFVRGLVGSLVRQRTVAEPATEVPQHLLEIVTAVADRCGLALTGEDVERACRSEAWLHSLVSVAPEDGFAEALAKLTLARRPDLEVLASAPTELQRLRDELAVTRERATRLESEMQRARREFGRHITKLRHELETVHHSLTWRWTGWLRWLARSSGSSWHATVRFGLTMGRLPGALLFCSGPRNRRAAVALATSGFFDSIPRRAEDQRIDAGSFLAAVDYLRRGAKRKQNPHPLFDASFYLETNRDVAATGVEPLLHFVEHGAFEGRSPHPLFDTKYYLATNPDVAASGINPLMHFLRDGGFEGRRPSAHFDPSAYLTANPDVRDAGINPLVHFVLSKRAGRS